MKNIMYLFSNLTKFRVVPTHLILHILILSDIALNIGEAPEDLQHANALIASNVRTRADTGGRSETLLDKENPLPRAFMPASRVLRNIAFGELIVNFTDAHISENVNTLLPVLIDVLRDIPDIDFDKCLSWEGTIRLPVYLIS
ncbi:uncharacterized protein C8R40DRAFT_1200842 [Lentinula edodes]|uniref:uncharacterized protein n=1 Tax=Lentinula edodes TaxID=5353 RepID=UPI001E8CD93A|nr:uncharacterized protein C8R40DRAFT_1200842 [Lentinula edodes]KAH7879655.1 hypothetical protein C8R40DRAFT_1200842 [Lentinula edodes]